MQSITRTKGKTYFIVCRLWSVGVRVSACSFLVLEKKKMREQREQGFDHVHKRKEAALCHRPPCHCHFQHTTKNTNCCFQGIVVFNEEERTNECAPNNTTMNNTVQSRSLACAFVFTLVFIVMSALVSCAPEGAMQVTRREISSECIVLTNNFTPSTHAIAKHINGTNIMTQIVHCFFKEASFAASA